VSFQAPNPRPIIPPAMPSAGPWQEASGRGASLFYLAPRSAESMAWDAYTTAHREANRTGGVEDLLRVGVAACAFSEAAW
jgi:hypothetical protein